MTSLISVTETLSEYLPTDRRHALARGMDLPETTQGAALFADVSGFTPLTQAFVDHFGPTHGAEKVSRAVNRVFAALVELVDNYGGSVIGFSGDAATCWFAGQTEAAGRRALACAEEMHKAMAELAQVEIAPGEIVRLAIKVAVACGPARRFLVGDPQVQIMEVLAGEIMDRLAAAEHAARKGETVIDAVTAGMLGEIVRIAEWREAGDGLYAVTAGLDQRPPEQPWPPCPIRLTAEMVRPWLLPAVFERIDSGQGEFLAEFRPAGVVFVHFEGIDYNHDPNAGDKLDIYIRKVQAIIQEHGGSLIQLTLGEKGSFYFASFGAPVAYDDFARRTTAAALALRDLPVLEADNREAGVQVGASLGRLLAGSYGGRLRRTYGVQGSDTNLAARLMQNAAPGQVLASKPLRDATAIDFAWEDLPPIQVKGRGDWIPVSALRGRHERAMLLLQEPRYTLPMVGRDVELENIRAKLDLARSGIGQVVGIAGEAGIGKSRLIAEVIRLANAAGFAGLGGEGESYGGSRAYLAWHPIWRSYFGVEGVSSTEDAAQWLEWRLRSIDVNLVARLPLLSAALNLPLPENDLTRSLDGKLRKIALENLLVDCLNARSADEPLLLVLDNLHWIDPLSQDLLEAVARAATRLPMLILVAYRPYDESQGRKPGLDSLPHFSEIVLDTFSAEEAARLVRLKLEQLYGWEGNLPPGLANQINRRAEGNPFYIEELLNYLRDREANRDDLGRLEHIDLPNSLHSLILTRIDQRTESQKITLKIASIIGRVFTAAWLWGAYPALGDSLRVRDDLEVLSENDLTSLEAAEPELTYLFRHFVTQEVAYDSLPFAMRAVLHDQLAQFLERTLPPEKLDQYVDVLAYHYERSENLAKKCEYLRKAGEAAQAQYALQTAERYYQALLPLVATAEAVEIRIKLGKVLELAGKWDEGFAHYQAGLDAAERLAGHGSDSGLAARCQSAIGELMRQRGRYDEAGEWLARAHAAFEQLGDLEGMGAVLHSRGTLAAQQGDVEAARQAYESSLVIRRQLGEQLLIASLMNNLGILARMSGDLERARSLQSEGLEIRRRMNDRFGIAASLNNLGNVALDLNEPVEALRYLEEAVALQREIGSKFYIANALNNLGNVRRTLGDHSIARQLYRESLDLNCELGDGWSIAYVLEDIGYLEATEGDAERALMLAGAAAALRQRTGSPLPKKDRDKQEEYLQRARARLSFEAQKRAWEAGRELSVEEAARLAA